MSKSGSLVKIAIFSCPVLIPPLVDRMCWIHASHMKLLDMLFLPLEFQNNMSRVSITKLIQIWDSKNICPYQSSAKKNLNVSFSTLIQTKSRKIFTIFQIHLIWVFESSHVFLNRRPPSLNMPKYF